LPLAEGQFWAKPFVIEDLEKYQSITLKTQYNAYDDVIRIDDDGTQTLRGKDIQTIFWSKSVGYVRCITNDGTIWDLVSQ
jgi:hypothetical protein